MVIPHKESIYYLKWDEVGRVIDAAETHRDRIIIKILARTGLRRAEVADLRVQDVDFERMRLYVRYGKRNKPRTVPVDPDTLDDIHVYLLDRKEGGLIHTNKSKCITKKCINDVCIKLGKLSGVRHPNPGRSVLNPHLFRHSFARFMLENGMHMEEVQQLLGHSHIITTISIYGTPTLNDVQESYDRIMGGGIMHEPYKYMEQSLSRGVSMILRYPFPLFRKEK